MIADPRRVAKSGRLSSPAQNFFGNEFSTDKPAEPASPHLNVRDIKSFPTPVAPLPEQQEIVRRVEGLFALADQLEVRLAKARGQVDQLTPSLLARAFAGQLVPQDPNDEPADELWKRIQNRTR